MSLLLKTRPGLGENRKLATGNLVEIWKASRVQKCRLTTKDIVELCSDLKVALSFTETDKSFRRGWCSEAADSLAAYVASSCYFIWYFSLFPQY